MTGRLSGKTSSTGLMVTLLAVAVVLIDQITKYLVKTGFYLGEDLAVTSWFHLKFIENNGMAFGLQLWNKYLLTFGRIAAVAFFIWFTVRVLRTPGLRRGFFVAMALVIAGAAGNIFDCVFYGVVYNDPWPPEIASLFPEGGGYAPLFQGRVVDMLYFPLFTFTWPSWVPGVGGAEFEFFQYIFNVADASICVGVFLLLIFYGNDASRAFNAFAESLRKKDDPKMK